MSRNQSTIRIFCMAFGLQICAAVVPTFSQVPVSNARFSITFPSGWMKLPASSQSDSAGAVLIHFATGASTFLFAAPHEGNLTAAEIIAAIKDFGTTDSVEVAAEGAKTLGGKSFSFIEWKKAGATGDEALERYRVYFHTTGTFMFEGILGFDTDNAASAIGDMETALATLNLTGSTAIRRLAAKALRPTSVRANRDVLGRQARLPYGTRHPLTQFTRN
ncbi:MAG: hypothetical protein ABIW76_11120 [Fibrobacteria bacterium]